MLATSGAIPAGSTVLVTGANGFLGSHIAEALLAAGYKVRGTARSVEKMAAMKAIWDAKFGEGRFETCVVEDMSVPGGHDHAVKGVSAVAHVASILDFNAPYEKVVPVVVAATTSVMRSAAAEPSVKRFVLTSSSTAAVTRRAGDEQKGVKFDATSWDEEISAKAQLPGASPWDIYGASKMEGEKAAWAFMKEVKPAFKLNTVLPNANFGRILEPTQSASTAGWVQGLFKGSDAMLAMPPQWFVNPSDTALIHLAALTFPDVANERLWAVSAPFNWNDVLAIFRRQNPGKTFPKDLDNDERDLSEIDNARGTEILKALGRPGWKNLEESIKENTEGL